MDFKNRVATSEELGREKTIRLFGDKITLVASEKRYERWDLSGSSIGHLGTKEADFYLEVKDRNYASTDFKSDYLELDKFNSLINVGEDANHYYLMFFNDGICRLYHLDDIKLQDVDIQIRSLPSTIDKDIYSDTLTILLPSKLAKTLKYD